MVPIAQDCSPSSTRRGETQHPGGCLVQTSLCSSHGMDDRPPGSGESVVPLPQADGGPVCDQVQQSASSVRVPSPRPASVGSGRALPVVGRADRLRLPTTSDSSEGGAEGSRGGRLPSAGRPQVARPALVPRSSSRSATSSSSSESLRSRTGSTAHRSVSRERSGSQPSRLAHLRQSLSSLGASQDTIDFVESAHRSGTQKVYDSKWAKWRDWCQLMQVDPIKPQNVDLVNFLAQLAAQDGLAPATVKTYRSAIVTTLKQLGGRVRGESSQPTLITQVVKGIELKASTIPKRNFSWELFLILEALRSLHGNPCFPWGEIC